MKNEDVIDNDEYENDIDQDEDPDEVDLNVDEVAGVVDSLDHNEIRSGSDSRGSFPSCTLSGQVVGIDASYMSIVEIVIKEVIRG